MNFFHTCFYQSFNILHMKKQSLHLIQIYVSKLHFFHKLHQCPKGLWGTFDMKEQDGSNHVNALSISQFNVINAIRN